MHSNFNNDNRKRKFKAGWLARMDGVIFLMGGGQWDSLWGSGVWGVSPEWQASRGNWRQNILGQCKGPEVVPGRARRPEWRDYEQGDGNWWDTRLEVMPAGTRSWGTLISLHSLWIFSQCYRKLMVRAKQEEWHAQMSCFTRSLWLSP